MQGISGIGLKLILMKIEFMFNVYQTTNGNQLTGQLVKMVDCFNKECWYIEKYFSDIICPNPTPLETDTIVLETAITGDLNFNKSAR